MEAEMQRSWRLHVRAKAKNFDFKLKATATSLLSSWRTWKLHRLSLLLRLHKFRVNVDSESGTAPFLRQQQQQRRRKTLISKVFSFFKRFQTRQAKMNRPKKTLNSRYPDAQFPVNRSRNFPYAEPICIGCVMIGGIPEFVSKKFSEKDKKEIIVHGWVILLCIAVCFQKYTTGKASALLVYLMAATVLCSVLLHLDFYISYCQGNNLPKLVWKAWNYAASSGCLYAFFQAILSRICPSGRPTRRYSISGFGNL